MTTGSQAIATGGIIIGMIFMFAICVAVGGWSLDSNVITDKTVHVSSSHALYRIVTILPGAGTYCIHAETLSRGEPVTVGLHYIIEVPTTADRFGATRPEQRGAVFTTDNNHVVNETVTVPEGATDAIITASYSNYVDLNPVPVHIKVEKCGGKP